MTDQLRRNVSPADGGARLTSNPVGPPHLSRPSPSLSGDGMNPEGCTCSKCRERPATMAWGDVMTINHGGGAWRCDTCALTEQLAYARARAAVIPELERKLAEAIKDGR